VGNYGSGKSEVAVNLAIYHRRCGMEVRFADLDLVNPYFRSREARKPLRELGIEVTLPPEAYLHADLPILSPLVSGLIRQPGELTILDVGGNDVGARVLAALGDAFATNKCQMLQVVNHLRPDTSTIPGCLKIRHQIEAAADLPITGLIGNANLIDETTPEIICDGYAFMRELSQTAKLPLKLITIPEELQDLVDPHKFDCPILPIRRQLMPPWKIAKKP
jgi:hypothetical protein